MDRRNFLLWGGALAEGLAVPGRAYRAEGTVFAAITRRGSHLTMYDDQQGYFRELGRFLKERA